METKINYHAEISLRRGKTYLKPAGDAELAMLKRLDFRAGGALFAATCKALQKQVAFVGSATSLAKLDPFGILMGDVGIPSQPKSTGKAAAKATKAKARVVRVCVDINCKCRGYHCTCTSKVYRC